MSRAALLAFISVGGVLSLSVTACDDASGPDVALAQEGTGGSGGQDPGGVAAGAPGSAGAPTVASGFGQTITGAGTATGFHTFEMTIDGESYSVQTNPWGGAEQTIAAGDGKVFEITSLTIPAGGEAWDVATFPSVYKGTAQGGNPTEDSGMPILVSDLTAAPTGLSTNASLITYNGNTTYDVYFTDAEDYRRGAPDVYLMVWFHAHALNPINGPDEQWSCRSQPPTYIDSCTGAGSIVVDGKTFHRFIGDNGSSKVISYAPEVPLDEWEFDLKVFIDDALSQGVVDSAMYLQSVQAGFEVADGGEGLAVNDFYVHIQ